MKRKMKSTDQLKNLIRDKQIAELRSLSCQLNPHFFFNSLNAVQYSILQSDTERAITFLSNFSQLMRKVLDNSMYTSISLTEEIDFLRTYVNLEQERLNRQFDYTFSLEGIDDSDEIFVPPMMLQPIIENAIVHGLSGEPGGQLSVHFKIAEDYLHCIVEDNGRGLTQKAQTDYIKKHKSYGLKLNRERLRIIECLCGKETSISVTNKKRERGVMVTLKIPLEFSEILGTRCK